MLPSLFARLVFIHASSADSKVIFSVERDASMQSIIHSAVAEILASAAVGASSPTQSTCPRSTIDTESAQVSIAHLTFNRKTPLAREIEAYQSTQQETETTAGRLLSPDMAVLRRLVALGRVAIRGCASAS
jgi:hypothetical protein